MTYIYNKIKDKYTCIFIKINNLYGNPLLKYIHEK